TDNGDGTYTAQVVASATADTEPFTATDTTAGITSTFVDLVETAVPQPAVATVTLSKSSITADGKDTTVATIKVTDGSGNPLPGQTVVLATNGHTSASPPVDQ